MDIAKKHAINVGWAVDNIGFIRAEFIVEESKWFVSIDGKEAIFGDHISFLISTDGEIIEIFPGK